MLILILLVLLGLWVGSLLLRLLKKPIKWCFKLLLHVISGCIYLLLFNLTGAVIGLTLEIDLLNCLIAGIFGIPGVLLLLLLAFF